MWPGTSGCGALYPCGFHSDITVVGTRTSLSPGKRFSTSRPLPGPDAGKLSQHPGDKVDASKFGPPCPASTLELTPQ
jgi:hypothetical protein